MKPKWMTFLQAFLITFGVAAVVLVGVSYLTLYRPRLVAYRGGSQLPPAAEAAVPVPPEPDLEAAAAPAAEPTAPPADESGIVRTAPAPAARPAVSGRRQPVDPALDLPRTGEARPPAPICGAARPPRSRSFTGTHKGAFLSAGDQPTLDAVRRAAQAIAPEGRRSGLKSLVETGGVLTARLAQPDPQGESPDPAALLDLAAGALQGAEAGSIKRIEIMQGTETVASRDL